jgi:hypothetical protein
MASTAALLARQPEITMARIKKIIPMLNSEKTLDIRFKRIIVLTSLKK